VESLTVHYLARELHERWSGRRVAVFVLDDRATAVILGAAGSVTVRFDLSRPDVRVHETQPVNERGPLDGVEIESVAAPTDDRRIVIAMRKPGKFRGSAAREAELVVSLIPNARGAALVGRDGHRYGSVGSPIGAARDPRPVLDAEALRAAADSGDAGALMRGRWLGPAVARWLQADPARMVERYAGIASLPVASPARCGGELLPFPMCDDAESADSLIEPQSSRSRDTPDDTDADDPRTKAIARMRDQLVRAAEAPMLRAAADALMALQDGAAMPPSLTLPDGNAFRLTSRADETAPQLAERLYARARSMERARATLPERIAALEARKKAKPAPAPTAGGIQTAPEPRQPYKRYTSRSGLEIRVGRSAKDNDALTFHASAPDDVWLHAQGATGSHVVLRWTQDGSPPPADLEDAALLAAWHSRARGSTVVPVDWTRRRYVRKPRGASPGSVVLSRAETVFVRPTAAAVRTIRDRG
jgi:hypothetical protein